MTDTPITTPTLRNLLPKSKSPRAVGASIDDWLLSEPHHPCRAEQAIWRAVLVQMLTDALSRSRKRETRRLKREALDWLSGKSRDFRTVCDYAGYEPAYLHGKIMQLLAAHQVQALPVPLKRLPTDIAPNQRYIKKRDRLLHATKQTAQSADESSSLNLSAESSRLPTPPVEQFSIRLPRMQTRLTHGINLTLIEEDSE